MRRMQALAYVLCTAGSLVDAFTVTSEPVAPMPPSPTDAHRLLEQRYLVSQPLMDNMLNHEELQTLKINLPGRVFVSYNYDLQSFSPTSSVAWPSPAATIRFSGNAEELFEHFEVVSTAPHTVEVRRRANVRGSLHDAYLLTEISISQPHSISEIVTSSSADVIIEDQVLVSDGQKPLSLQLSGSGNVYVDSKSSSVTASVHLTVSGSGDIHWNAAALQTQSFKVDLSGSGDITVLGQTLDTTAMEVHIAGSGDVCVDAANIQTNTVFTATAGSGTISFSSPSGHCNREDISILGSGDVFAGALQCNDVKVTVAGSGDIYVQAVHSITGSAWGSGDIKYVGVTPQLIADRRDSSVFSSAQSKKYHPIAKYKASNKHSTCRAKQLPLRAAVSVSLSAFGNSSSILGPIVFLAILSLCYLRGQVKRTRRSQRDRAPRFGGPYRPIPQEMQPLQPAYPPNPYQPQQPQQPQAVPNSQVYV